MEGEKCRGSLQLSTGQKKPALDAAAMQIMRFAVGDTAPQFLRHEKRGIKSIFIAVPPDLQEKKV